MTSSPAARRSWAGATSAESSSGACTTRASAAHVSNQDNLALRERKPIGKGCLDRETDSLESVSEIVWVCCKYMAKKFKRKLNNKSINKVIRLFMDSKSQKS